MSKAFTLIELIFVIVIVGILGAFIAPKVKSNTINQTKIQLISAIRYTQHLAIVDDVYNSNDNNWMKKRWCIYIKNNTYTIKSDNIYAKDPETKKNINKISLKIDNIELSGGCFGKNGISFDYLGRPYAKNETDDNAGNMLVEKCIIELKNGEKTEKITIEKETGYAH